MDPSPTNRAGMVAHLSDLACGGAAASADRLVEGLLSIGTPAERWTFSHSAQHHFQIPSISLEQCSKRPLAERLIKNISKKAASRLRSRRHRDLLLAKLKERNPRILHLHNLHASGITHDDLLAIPPEVPIVWTLHDEWPVLPWAYQWKDRENHRVTEGAEIAPIGESLLRRKSFFENRKNLILVSPSRWLAGVARQNTPPGTLIAVIPNGISAESFSQVPKEEAQKMLGLDPDHNWIGFAASSIDARKGGDIFLKALSLCSHQKNLGIVIWGDDSQWHPPTNIRVHRFGFISDEARLSQLYSACNIFACPSMIDNLPNTVLESMACGTPVIGSQIGGIPDMVHQGKTGWLYVENSPERCAEAIDAAIREKDDWPHYGERCRNVVLHEYNLQLQANRYLEAYTSLT